MGKRPWTRFYHQDWAASLIVMQMGMEERGTYFTLLNRQMIDGYVNLNDKEALMEILKAKDEDEVNRLLTKRILSKFEPIPNNPDKFINRVMQDVMEETDAASTRGRDNVKKRAPISYGTTTAEPENVFDFSPIVNAYPKVKHRTAGWNKGVQLMQDTITTDEDYTRLHAAVKAYAKSVRGKDPTFIKNFDNFMRDWGSYLPKTFQEAKEEPKEPSEEPVSEPSLRHNEKPPWELRENVSDYTRRETEAFWTEERKEAWRANKPIPQNQEEQN